MQLTLKDGLPFISVRIAYGEAMIDVSDVLVDTGSASTIFAAKLCFESQNFDCFDHRLN